MVETLLVAEALAVAVGAPIALFLLCVCALWVLRRRGRQALAEAFGISFLLSTVVMILSGEPLGLWWWGFWEGAAMTQQYNPPPPAGGIPAGPPPNYLVQSILVTILCCLPLGIAGIVFAAQVNSKWAAGDHQGALEASAQAKRWSTIGAVAGLVVGVIWLIISLVGGGMATSGR